MKLKVICKKCDRIFSWNAEKEIEICPYCDTELTIKNVRMNPAEIMRYKKFKETQRFKKSEIQTEEPTINKISSSLSDQKQKRTTISSKEQSKKETYEDLEGRYIINKGRTKYGTLELTNPDYMILKLSFWAMGPNQKEVTSSLTKKIINDLTKNGFDIKKR